MPDFNPAWTPSPWLANIWLLFLAFPILAVSVGTDISTSAKVVAVGSLVLFGVADAIGERSHVRNEWIGCSTPTTTDPLKRALDPRDTVLWFGLMVIFLTVATIVGGPGALGALPFVVSYAVFTFSWRITGAIFAFSMLAVVAIPLSAGLISELWFLPLIVAGVGGASAILRLSIDRAIEYNELQTELRMSEDRTRVARDVHDVLGHSLTAIVLKTQVTNALLAELDDIDTNSPDYETLTAAREQLAEMQEVSRQALSEIRTTVTGLRIGDLNGEIEAARSILDDAGVTLDVEGELDDVPEELAPVLSWVVREAVTNVVRHAKASSVSIELAGPEALLAVSDDGTADTNVREGNGLTGLRERLRGNGLQLVINRRNGTELAVLPAEVTP